MAAKEARSHRVLHIVAGQTRSCPPARRDKWSTVERTVSLSLPEASMHSRKQFASGACEALPARSERACRALARPALSLSPQALVKHARFPSLLSHQCRVTETPCAASVRGGWQPPAAYYVHPRRCRLLLGPASNPVSFPKRRGRLPHSVVLVTTICHVAGVISS